MMGSLSREARFFTRQPARLASLVLLCLLAISSLLLGRAEIQRQEQAIERMQVLAVSEREAVKETVNDYGEATYYNFYVTWNSPSELAFVALGQRDVSPYMSRIRALALEGQIYASDSLNPELGLAGRFDYAFLVAFLLPLFVAYLFYDVASSEREAGRYALLVATAGQSRRLWWPKAAVRLIAVLACLLVPFWILALIDGVSAAGSFKISLVVAGQVIVWAAISGWFASRTWTSATIAFSIVTTWLVLCLIVPLGASHVIDRISPAAEGADIALVQREAVNDAWDLPKASTMEPFFDIYPEWSETAPITKPFEWKWYFAFQHIGDVTASEVSTAYRRSIATRDALAGSVAVVSPSLAVQRLMQRVGETDVQASLRYDTRIRNYHEAIRHFYYPYLYTDEVFDKAVMDDAPLFGATERPDS